MLIVNTKYYSLFGRIVILLLTKALFGCVISTAFVLPSLQYGNSYKNAALSNTMVRGSIPGNTSYELMIERAKLEFKKFERGGKGNINSNDFDEILAHLDLDAITAEERKALFLYLDMDGNGSIDVEEFISWYSDAAKASIVQSQNFRNLVMSRRTVNNFDKTPVSDQVLRRAIECALAAPNRSMSEPWRFIKAGPKTVSKLQLLNQRVIMAGGEEVTNRQQKAPLLPKDWTEIPGWCIVTSKVNPNDPETELRDFRSTSCAMQNFMLSMWSEGVGSKWTEGPTQKMQQFADIVGIDTSKEKVVGIIWYGFTTSGLSSADPKRQRKKGVDDVLSILA